MMENGMWPLNGANKEPPQPTSADGNDNTGRACHIMNTSNRPQLRAKARNIWIPTAIKNAG